MVQPVLDLEEALGRVGGDTDLLREISALFLSDYPNQLAALSQAIAISDPAQVEKAAHTLKGSVATFGAAAAVDAALALEHAGRTGNLDRAYESLTVLKSLLGALHSELDTFSKTA